MIITHPMAKQNCSEEDLPLVHTGYCSKGGNSAKDL